MKLMLIATILVTCLLMTGLNTKAMENDEIPNIRITEFLYNPVILEVEGEFVEIKNLGNETVDLSGWILTDQDVSDDPTGSYCGPRHDSPPFSELMT